MAFSFLGVSRHSSHNVPLSRVSKAVLPAPLTWVWVGPHRGMPELEESRRGVVDPRWVREPRDREGGSWGGEKRSGVTFARGSVDGDMLGRRDCTRCFNSGQLWDAGKRAQLWYPIDTSIDTDTFATASGDWTPHSIGSQRQRIYGACMRLGSAHSASRPGGQAPGSGHAEGPCVA